jgi:hypothetical protein
MTSLLSKKSLLIISLVRSNYFAYIGFISVFSIYFLLSSLSFSAYAETPTQRYNESSSLINPTSHLREMGIPVLSGEGEIARTACATRELVLGLSPKRSKLNIEELQILLTSNTLIKPNSSIDGVNISVRCQIGYFIRDNQIIHVFPVSTGKFGFRTKQGNFKVGWRVDGWRESRSYPGSMLYRPLYFFNGQAIHGMTADRMVKSYPASHGCVRVHRDDADWLWENLKPNDRIKIYGAW